MPCVGVLALLATTAFLLNACEQSREEPKPPYVCPQGTTGSLTVAGNVEYEMYLPAVAPGAKIDYAAGVTVAPVRRAVIQVMSGTKPIACGLTDDDGNYSISLNASAGSSLYVRVQAKSTVTSYQRDGKGGAAAEYCHGASWDLRVVDNVTNSSASTANHSLRPLYALDSATFSAPSGTATQTVDLVAGMNWSASSYTERAGAPFALLDTMVSGIETTCQGRADISFPLLYVNWSEFNTTNSGNRYQGNIGTSFYTEETAARVSNLYILGRSGVDTDELDQHVVAHEFGHFIENRIYRSDSIGGSHSISQVLDTRVAFGEGFGNAFAAVVHNSPLYIDTQGANQTGGFHLNIDEAPATDVSRGIFSEKSMQYMLWSLWDDRGSYDRIHTVLENDHKNADAATNGLTFAASYAKRYGSAANGLDSLWTTDLNSPLGALCEGGDCSGTPTYSPWDTGNLLGTSYAPNRRYWEGGSAMTANFWRIYRQLTSGVNVGNDHDVISFGGYSVGSANLNKFGVRRLYRLRATGATTIVHVTSINQGAHTCSSGDLLDIAVYYRGTMLGFDDKTTGATANCPRVQFASVAGRDYVVEVIGYGAVSGYNITVSP
ncbi:MAG: hypothetical protein RBT63_03140, partial [Bdellovibrionales bacterium]|jgi:hypothetical protein|nr:hypothetical protein [Bdellovibrionales bacterium]